MLAKESIRNQTVFPENYRRPRLHVLLSVAPLQFGDRKPMPRRAGGSAQRRSPAMLQGLALLHASSLITLHINLMENRKVREVKPKAGEWVQEYYLVHQINPSYPLSLFFLYHAWRGHIQLKEVS